MSEARLRLIAIASAIVALGLAVVAAIVVTQRRDRAPGVETRAITAADLDRLVNRLEPAAGGVRVNDPELAQRLAVDDDVIAQISAVRVASAADVRHLIDRAVDDHARSFFVDRARRGLVRWDLDHALEPDPLLALERIDTTHFAIPRRAADELVAYLVAHASDVHAVSAGGLQIATIAPGSVFSRMGLREGDRIVAMNGERVATPDDLLKAYSGAKHITIELERAGRPVFLNVDVR